MLGAYGVQWPGAGRSVFPGEAGCLLEKKWEYRLGL